MVRKFQKTKRDIASMASHLAFLHPCRENKLIDSAYIDLNTGFVRGYKDCFEALMRAVNEA